MYTERRIDVPLAAVVRKGFDLNFSHGFRASGEFLRSYLVPSQVVIRVINYGPRRTSDWEQ